MLKAVTNLPRRLRAWRFRLQPQAFWQAYSARAHTLGFEKLYLVPSFDCDTDEDIPAAKKMHDWLRARGCRAVFAVPGAQLQAGAKIFRKMADEGAEFINHGAAPHTEFRDGRHWSVTFYDQMTPDEVEQDVRQGHEILQEVISKAPKGFRAPHFGHYQNKRQLKHLHSILLDLGYTYTSTTLPSAHSRPSPRYVMNGLQEFPVSGRYNAPLHVFDSYGHLKSYTQPQVTREYGERLIATVQKLKREQVAGVLNYYCDPAHVAGSHSYYQALSYCLDNQISLVTFEELIGRLDAAKGAV